MLSGFIHKRHDDIDSLRLSRRCRDDTLQVRIVVVRRHVIHIAEDGIGHRVIHDIDHKVDIHTANRLQNLSLRFSCSKTGNLRGYDIIRFLISGKCNRFLVFTLPLRSP